MWLVPPFPSGIPAPYRGTGHAFDRRNDEFGGGEPFIFVPIAHAGWRRGHQGMKSRSCGLVQRIGTADSAHAPTPTPAGDKPPRYIFSFRHRPIGLQFGTFRRRRAGIEVDWRAHPGSESGTCFRTNDDMRFADYRNDLGGLTVSTNCLSA